MDTEEKHVLYKSLVSRRENYYNPTIKATQLKAKNVKRPLTKEYIQMATKHTILATRAKFFPRAPPVNAFPNNVSSV